MRGLRLAMLAVVVLVMLGTVASQALAAPSSTTLVDDNLAVGTTVTQSTNGEIRTSDPQSLGFTLGAAPGNGVLSNRVCGGGASVISTSPTNSPPNALEFPFCGGGGGEFNHEGALFTLNDTADTVSAYVGNPSAAGLQFRLDAYDVQHNLVYSTTVTAAQGITTPISVGTSGTYIIAFVALYNTAAVGQGDAFDDLTVHSGGGSPEISLSSPVGGSPRLSQGGSLQYSITIVRHNASNGDVTLGLSGLPPGPSPDGVTSSFGANPVSGTNTDSSLTLTVGTTQAVGMYPVTLTATPSSPSAGTHAQSINFYLHVVHPFDVLVGSLTTIPSATGVNLPPCSSAAAGVNTVLNPGFDPAAVGPVKLALLSANASGIAASLQKPSLGAADFQFGDNTQSLNVSRDSSAGPTTGATFAITPTSGPFSSDPATVIVYRTPPDITSLSRNTGRTPQALQPGTSVTIDGRGFCPDSSVAFGSGDATATAESVNAAGTELTVHVPVGATTGHVTVTSGGMTGTSPAEFSVDNFRNTNGYAFHNFNPNLEFDHMTEAFGYHATHTVFGTPDPVAFLVSKIARALYRGKNGGACFGFSLSAARLMSGEFLPAMFSASASSVFDVPGPPPIPEPGPDHNDALYSWFHDHHPWHEVSDYITWNHVQELSWEFLGIALGESAYHGNQSGPGAATSVYNELKAIFAKGDFPMFVLSFEHVVTAYNIEGTPPDYYVDVWDSNAPFPADFTSSRLHITSNGNYFLPSTGINGSKIGLVVMDPASIPRYPTLVGQGPLNKYFATDGHGRGAQPASASSSLDSIVLDSAGPVGGAGDAALNAPSKVTQVTDGVGRALYSRDGQLNPDNATRPNAMSFTFPDSAVRVPLLALGQHRSPITLTVGDTGSGADTHTVLGHGFTEEITTQAARGSNDRLSLGADAATGFSTTAASKPLTVTMIGGSAGNRRIAEVDTTSYGRGGGDTVSFNGGIAYRHRGRATTFTIALSGTSARTGASRFDSGPLTIASGQTAQITHVNWDSLNNSVLTVRIGGRTLTVRNHAGTLQLARISGLTVTRTAGKARQLTISAAARKLPAGAQLAFSWLIRGGRHSPVAHSLLAQPRTKSAIYTFNAPRRGRYTVSATISVVMPNGSILSTSTRSLAFKV